MSSTVILKYIVLIFNVFLGLACFGIIKYGGKAFNGNVPEEFGTIGILFAYFGIVISILGNYAVIKTKCRLILTYALTLLILQCLTIIALSLAYDVTSLSLRTLNTAWEEEKKGNDGMTNYQEKFHCCGIYGPQNYNDTEMPYPTSCFSKNHVAFDQGCLDKLTDMYDIGLERFMTAGWILLAVQFILYVCATILGVVLRGRMFKYTVNKMYINRTTNFKLKDQNQLRLV